MDKWEAQYAFWSQFGIPAYEENSVPTGDDRPSYPYLTYQAVDAPFNEDVPTTASIWTKDYSWAEADGLANAVMTALKNGGYVQFYTGGMVWYTIDQIQAMGDTEDDTIKRKVLNMTAHFA